MAKSNRSNVSSKAKSKPKRHTGASKLRTSAKKSKPSTKLSNKASQSLGDWREETLAQMRSLILEADPEMIEERKWKKPSNPAGVPTFSQNGIVCTLETYKNVVKLTFAKGASIPDPSRLFNASLEGNARRAIDIHEGEAIDAGAFKKLVKAAVKKDTSTAKK